MFLLIIRPSSVSRFSPQSLNVIAFCSSRPLKSPLHYVPPFSSSRRFTTCKISQPTALVLLTQLLYVPVAEITTLVSSKAAHIKKYSVVGTVESDLKVLLKYLFHLLFFPSVACISLQNGTHSDFCVQQSALSGTIKLRYVVLQEASYCYHLRTTVYRETD